VVAEYATGETGDGYPEEWDLDKLWRAFRQLFPIGVSVDEVVEEAGGDRSGLSCEFITEAVTADAQAAYDRREQEFGPEVTRELERRVVLSVLDRKWREHLYEMDYLREGIALRGYGQRDPLVEYQREGYDMFTAMMDGIKEESVGNLFNLQVQVQENPIVEEMPADGVPGPGAPGVPAGPTPAADAPAVAGPAIGASVPAQAPPGVSPGPAGPARAEPPAQGGAPARRGAHARGSTPARSGGQGAQSGQSGQRGQRNQRGQAGQGTRGGGAHARPAAAQADPAPAGLGPRRTQQLQYSAPSVDGGAHVETTKGPASGDEFSRVGRNDPCPCGSGRKFKRCHGDPRMRPDL